MIGATVHLVGNSTSILSSVERWSVPAGVADANGQSQFLVGNGDKKELDQATLWSTISNRQSDTIGGNRFITVEYHKEKEIISRLQQR